MKMPAEANDSGSTLSVLQVDDDLTSTINEIGLARFVGRINSGVIPAREGYAAVESFVANEKSRPLISRITQVLLGRPNPYVRR